MGGTSFEEFVVHDEIKREDIEDLINEYATIDFEEGLIEFHDEFQEAPTAVQLLVPLLALYAFKLEDQVDSPAMDPVKLAEITDHSVGDAYPVIRELEQRGLIKNVGKEYQIAPGAKSEIESKFSSDRNTETVCA